LRICARKEYAEYAAHGERLGLTGSAMRYSSADRRDSLPAIGPDIETSTRTLLVVEDIHSLRATAAREALYDFGAVAVKDPTGHWRFSPYRKAARGIYLGFKVPRAPGPRPWRQHRQRQRRALISDTKQ
jgi:hypothetical protein